MVKDREAWVAAVHEVAKSLRWLSGWSELHVYFFANFITNMCHIIKSIPFFAALSYFFNWSIVDMGFPGGASGKEPTCQCRIHEMWAWSMSWEDCLEEGIATLFSILAWGIPWTEAPGRLLSIWFQRIGPNWSDITHTRIKCKEVRPLEGRQVHGKRVIKTRFIWLLISLLGKETHQENFPT